MVFIAVNIAIKQVHIVSLLGPGGIHWSGGTLPDELVVVTGIGGETASIFIEVLDSG